MKKVLIYGVLGLLVAVIVLSGRVRTLKREKIRLEANQETLLSDVRYYRTSDSLNAAGVNRLTLTCREFRRHAEELTGTVESLKLKVKRLQAVSGTGSETQYDIKTAVRDSLVVRDSLIVDTLKCVSYADAWLTFNGCTVGKEFRAEIESRDSLITVVHRIPRKFWFIRWGTKAVRQDVISRNPHSRITYTKYIELKR